MAMAKKSTKSDSAYQVFKTDLAAGKIANAYVFYGEESYLREYFASLDEAGKAEAYVKIKSIMPADMLDSQVEAQMAQYLKELGL